MFKFLFVNQTWTEMLQFYFSLDAQGSPAYLVLVDDSVK